MRINLPLQKGLSQYCEVSCCFIWRTIWHLNTWNLKLLCWREWSCYAVNKIFCLFPPLQKPWAPRESVEFVFCIHYQTRHTLLFVLCFYVRQYNWAASQRDFIFDLTLSVTKPTLIFCLTESLLLDQNIFSNIFFPSKICTI